MRRWIVAIGVGLLVLSEMLFAVPYLFAQSSGGAFEQLSPGNQKITRALFEAQPTQPPPGTRRLTLDEIAARKRGEGWGRVFDGMRAEGLTTTKNLGQSVSSFNHRHHVSTGTMTTAANRTVRTGGNSANAGRHAAVKTNNGDHHAQTVVTARGATTTAGAQSSGGSVATGAGHGAGRTK
jgi:hypothetical protein